jgi:hypothetical protein
MLVFVETSVRCQNYSVKQSTGKRTSVTVRISVCETTSRFGFGGSVFLPRLSGRFWLDGSCRTECSNNQRTQHKG